MRRARLCVVFLAAVAALVLSGAAVSVAGAASNPGDHTAPLDTGYENVGEVTVDGTTYEVYRYENVLPYASGYEFFADGERVDDSEEAERVALAYGWKVAMTEEMDDGDVETLRGVGTTARRAGTVVSAPLSAIDAALTAVDAADGIDVPFTDTSVWDVATSVSPEIRGVESALRTTREELRRWDDRVGNIGDDVTRVADEAETVRASGETEYDELSALFEDAAEGLEEAEEISDALAVDLSRVAERTGEIADDLDDLDIPRVGDRLASPFRRVSTSLENATTTVEAFSESASESREVIEATRERAETEESATATGWGRRQTAALRVYGTGVALLTLVVAVGGYAYRRRLSAEETRPDE